jgi:GH18 family chitinase
LDVRETGFSTGVTLFFDDGYPRESYPFIRNGQFNPYNDTAIGAWPTDLRKLKQSGSSVKEIFFSIGGWGGAPDYPVKDFVTIQYMLDNGMKDVLVENFKELQRKFPTVDGFDLDCEEFGNSPNQSQERTKPESPISPPKDSHLN